MATNFVSFEQAPRRGSLPRVLPAALPWATPGVVAASQSTTGDITVIPIFPAQANSVGTTALTLDTIAPVALQSAGVSITHLALTRHTQEDLTCTDSAFAGSITIPRTTVDTLWIETRSGRSMLGSFVLAGTDALAGGPAVSGVIRDVVYAQKGGHTINVVENSIAIDVLARDYAAKRTEVDTLTLTAPVSRKALSVRLASETNATTEGLTASTSFPVMLAESVTLTEAPTRVHASIRGPLSESLTVSDAPIVHKRALVELHESLALSLAITAQTTTPRINTETLSLSEACARAIALRRSIATTSSVIEQIRRAWSNHRSVNDSLVLDLSTARTLHALRESIDTTHVTEVLTRHDPALRVVTETLPLYLDINTHLANHPRRLVETLTTHDSLAAITLLLAIMGYIREDPSSGEVAVDLPDWGYVLIENPQQGNAVTYAPIHENPFDPLREK